jgi:hypothetical protein
MAAQLVITVPIAVLASVAAAWWLSGDERNGLLAVLTLATGAVAASLFSLTDRDTGWVIPTAILLLLAPVTVAWTANRMVLGSAPPDQCVVTGVRNLTALSDLPTGVQHRQDLDCTGAGQRRASIADASLRPGQQISVRVDPSGRHEPVLVRGDQLPGATRTLALGLAFLLALTGSSIGTVRQARTTLVP